MLDRRQPPAVVEYVQWIRQPEPASGKEIEEVDAHIYRVPRQDDAEFFRFVAPGVRWMDLKLKEGATLRELKSTGVTGADEGLLLRLLFESISERIGSSHHLLRGNYLGNGADSHGDWLERLAPMKPCRTIVAHIGKDTYAYLHPFEPRPITMREAARIQSFPDFFSFEGVGVVDGYSMIGNAVPPLLARHLAARLWEQARDSFLFAAGTLPEEEIEEKRPRVRPPEQEALEFGGAREAS